VVRNVVRPGARHSKSRHQGLSAGLELRYVSIAWLVMSTMDYLIHVKHVQDTSILISGPVLFQQRTVCFSNREQCRG